MTESLWLDTASVDEAAAVTVKLTDSIIDELLRAPPELESRVYEAMRYSALAPGKRLRPLLVLASARLFGVARGSALQVAAAIEMVHAYSLIHDDLPAMDNSDLRRGRPTCHKAFDDATAVLAGDGLLTMAFEVLSHPDTHGDPAVRCELVSALAAAAGSAGMVGGQMIDLIAEKQPLDIGAITRLQRMKTGALIAFSCEAGAILAKASHDQRTALQRLCPRSRSGLPDRRRSARCRGLGGRDRQAGRRRRRGRKSDICLDSRGRAGARPGRPSG